MQKKGTLLWFEYATRKQESKSYIHQNTVYYIIHIKQLEVTVTKDILGHDVYNDKTFLLPTVKN